MGFLPKRKFLFALAVALLPAGCADAPQTTTQFVSASDSSSVVLTQNTTVPMPLMVRATNPLLKGTVWRTIGHCDQGDIYSTNDQTITITTANQRQAWPVVHDGQVVGFFLAVEKTFTPASKPVPFPVEPKK